MLFWPPENFSENGARPVQILGRSRPIDRLGALVFRSLDRHGNAIMGGGTLVPPTRIASRVVSRAGALTFGKTFLPKRTLGPHLEHSRWPLLKSKTQARIRTADRKRLTSDPLAGIKIWPKKPDGGDRPRPWAALFPSFELSKES